MTPGGRTQSLAASATANPRELARHFEQRAFLKEQPRCKPHVCIIVGHDLLPLSDVKHSVELAAMPELGLFFVVWNCAKRSISVQFRTRARQSNVERRDTVTRRSMLGRSLDRVVRRRSRDRRSISQFARLIFRDAGSRKLARDACVRDRASISDRRT